jgi:hypothetical protein
MGWTFTQLDEQPEHRIFEVISWLEIENRAAESR